MCINKHLRRELGFPFVDITEPIVPLPELYFRMYVGVCHDPPVARKDYARVRNAVARKAEVMHILSGNRELSNAKTRIVNVYRSYVASKLENGYAIHMARLKNQFYQACIDCGHNTPVFLKMIAQNKICEHIIIPLNLMAVFHGVPVIDWNLPGWGYSERGIRNFVSKPLPENLHWMPSVKGVHEFLGELWCRK